MSEDTQQLIESPSNEMEKAPVEKIKLQVESVTFKLGEKTFTLTYDDFVEVGIQDSWVVKRIGRDEDLLTAALYKITNG